MLEPTKVVVNGRTYTVNPFTPVEAFEFYHARLAAFRNGQSLFPFGMKAIGQCLDEMLCKLSDSTQFRKRFSECPEDMLPLQDAATEALIGPFERKEADTKRTEAD